MDAIARTLSKMSESRRHKCMIFFLFIFFFHRSDFFLSLQPFCNTLHTVCINFPISVSEDDVVYYDNYFFFLFLFDEFEYFFFQQRRQPFPRVVYDFPILLNIFCHVFLNVCTCFVYPMKERRTSLNTINLFFKNELSSTFNSS